MLWVIVQVVIKYSHVFLGPPSPPNIIYDSSERRLCFNSYSSYDDYPVQSFEIILTDATGIPSPLTNTYNTAGNQHCLNLNMDSMAIPDVCVPFQAMATASNSITGTSTATNYTSDSAINTGS